MRCCAVRRNHPAVRVCLFYICVVSLFLFGTILGNKTVTVIAEQVPVPRKHTIIIDPGHGGEDGGAVSCTGQQESGINLNISLRFNDLIHLLGYQSRMTRKNDTAIYTTGDTIIQKKTSDLKNRVAIVNSVPNSVLISIHQNDFPEKQYYGAQVFYAKTEHSQELAELIQAQFLRSLNPGSTRQAKEGEGIYLLKKTQAPSVLVECGFLSNPEEEALLRTPDYQKKICCVLAAAVSDYLSSLDHNSVS